MTTSLIALLVVIFLLAIVLGIGVHPGFFALLLIVLLLLFLL